MLMRRTALATASAVLLAGSWRSRAQSSLLRIGVLTDLSGPYRDINGPTAVAAVRMAAAEFSAANPSIDVEVLAADHQNKPDVGMGILRNWYDQGGVDMVTNLTNSAVALACNTLSAERNKVCVITAAGTSALTGAACTPNLVHWTYDSWNEARSTSVPVTRNGGSTWYIVTPNYAYSKALTADAGRFIEQAGGKVLGTDYYPFPETSDFSSFVVRAQSSGAKVIAFGAGGADLINFVKQTHEFGANRAARLVSMTGFITDVLGMAPEVSAGLTLTENFYWNLNDRTRSWFERIKPHLAGNTFPNMMHAGDYAATLHYLKAAKELGVAQAKASGRDVVAMMKRVPTDDECFGVGRIREDGRKVHPSYLFQVKPPGERSSVGDVYTLVATTGPDDAFRPLAEGGCPLVKT